MKCIKMIVPRMLIKRHQPHPEMYGESIVELLNGMVTDVYTIECGDLITETNNIKLIEYLKQNYIQDINYRIEDGSIRLRSIKQSDSKIVLQWMNQESFYSYNDMKYALEDIHIYISHSISSNSHLFIIEKNNALTGIAGYDVIDFKGIIDIKVYQKELMSNDDASTILKLLIKHIDKTHQVTDFYSLVLRDDLYSHQLYTRNNFVKDEMESLELPISESSYQKAYIYNQKSFDIKVTEFEKQILNEFLQLYPKKLYDLANPDELVDLEFSLDYELKIYIRLILTNQLNHRDEFEEIYVDDNGFLIITDNLIEKYDEMMALLSGEDLDIAILYKQLIFPVLEIINRHIKLYQEKQIYLSKINFIY